MQMTERKEPEFKKFNDGDVVDGLLLRIDPITIADERTNRQSRIARYVVQPGNLVGEEFRPDNSERVAFLGTYMINTALSRADIGKFVSVQCLGNDATVQREGRAMKKFKVLVSDEKPKSQEVFITDDDIPF